MKRTAFFLAQNTERRVKGAAPPADMDNNEFGKQQGNQNTGGYDAFQALNKARRDKNLRGAMLSGDVPDRGKVIYQNVLDYVQSHISKTKEYSEALTYSLDTQEGYGQLRNIIYTLLMQYTPPLDGATVDDFKQRIFDDMTGYSILTKYINDPQVEEINIYGPGSNQIEIISSEGAFMLEDGMPDADSVLNLVKRMVRKGGMTLDQSHPRVDSYMDAGTRISAMIPPVVREDKGAVASIRKQTESKIGRATLIRGKTAMEDELDLLDLCVKNKVSGAVVGATGSGKTTLLNYMMTKYVEESREQSRVFIIEESRELQLPADARVFYTAVCGEQGKEGFVSATDLLKSALRFHPTFISCAEMRGEEAMNAMMAAQTGHIVWSTFHAESGEDAYQRLLTMCKLSGTDLSEHLLMRNLTAAFPIIVSSQQMRDGTRKITGIYEADGTDGVAVRGHYIYKMQVTGYDYDEHGNVISVHGIHAKVGYLSDKLAQRIYDNSGRYDLLKKFVRPDWKPECAATSEQLAQGLSDGIVF